jgi:hypothetical protein
VHGNWDETSQRAYLNVKAKKEELVDIPKR